MVSFRKAFFVLAILVTIAGIVSAQGAPATCTAYTSNAPNVRVEGLAEEVGQVVIQCTGGTSVAAGQAISETNRINIQIFLNTNVTSRRTIANDNSALEAVLLIDEPTIAEVQPSTLCSSGSICGTTGVPNTGATTVGIGQRWSANTTNKNVYQGRLIANNAVIWTGIPFEAPGTGTRVMRIANIRAHANGLPLGSILPQEIKMFITISGTAAPNLQNNQLNVAYLQRGLRFGATNNAATFLQCEPSDGSTVKKFTLRFREWFPTAFRDNTIVTGNQADLTQFYNTESMYYHPTVAAAWTNAGLATQPTRLLATFTNVPTNVLLRVPRFVGTNAAGSDYVKYMQCFDGVGQSCSEALLSGTTVDVPVTGGSATIVYEFVSSAPGSTADIQIPVETRWGPIKDGIAGPPGTGTVTVQGSYAPLSSTSTAIMGPVPRFTSYEADKVSFSINPCRTNLLFPYITTQGGFDTGMVIANTSADKFSTVPQSGTCTLDYFGDVNGGAAPDSKTTDSIPAGQSLVASVAMGGAGKNGYGLTAAAGFQGYIIAKCNFQYAHGYAYVYSGPSFSGASGYLALVLDASKDAWSFIDANNNTITLSPGLTRTGSRSEANNQ